MIEIQNLTKRFGLFTAVDDISFNVEKGTVLGFLGPNGAGKSTTMKMITGFLAPTSGSAKVCGHDVQTDPIAAKEVMGYLPEGAPLYPDMTPRGFLAFVAELRGVTGNRKARIDEVVAKVNLQDVLDVPIETLSKGYKRRVGLAQAMLHDPRVLVLDEPTDGLDPNQKHEVRALIRSMAHDKVVILSTHILEEVEALCTRTIIIASGKLVVDCTPAQLAAKSRYHNAVSISIPTPQREKVEQSLRAMSQIASVELAGNENGSVCLTAFPRGGASIVADVGAKARDERWQVDEMRVEAGRLDEVFRNLTGFGSAA
ncbi:MAG TPA: ABC transporter ATP-binding protein, partial [Planctomycetota bacterium]|nr:ABC transporter ATP-binding protein [Planctomycetota bacterium]